MKKWIDADIYQLPDLLTTELERLKDAERARREKTFKHIRLYGNLDLTGSFDGFKFNTSSISQVLLKDRMKLNVCAATVDTAVSKASKNEPKAKFITSGGNWGNKRKAQLLEKLVWSCFLDLNIYSKARKMLRDACVTGTGVLKVCRDGSDIIVEKLFPWEIFIDPIDSIYGDPSYALQYKTVAKTVLEEDYPELASEIMQANGIEDDYVDVIEGWHVKIGDKPGKHTITLNNVVLLDEPYNSATLPFIFYNWVDPVVGFWGTGIVEQIEPIQVEINKTLVRIQRALELLGVPWVLLEKNSEVAKDALTNRIGQIIRYVRSKPEVVTHQAISQQTLVYLEMLYRRAFEISGISQQSAVSRKDPGITAGVAMREQQDIESERFMTAMKNYEDCFVRIALKIIDTIKEIAEDEGSYSIKIRADEVEEIGWKDIDLQDHQYSIQIFPVSSLPSRPEARLQMVSEYIQGGFLTQDEARDLFGFPDLDAEEQMASANREIIKKTVDEILSEGKPGYVDPFDNLQYALKYATNAYHKARIMDVNEEYLGMLRDYIDSIADALKPPAPPPGVMPPGMPNINMPQEAPVPTGKPAQPPIAELRPALPKQ